MLYNVGILSCRSGSAPAFSRRIATSRFREGSASRSTSWRNADLDYVISYYVKL